MSAVDRRRKAFQTRMQDTLAQVAAGEPDPRNESHPLTFRERLVLAPGLHGALLLLGVVTGMRDRLRCPNCTAVGTRKPHGGWVNWLLDSREDRKTGFYMRRWGCKWCGYWITKDGRTQAYPSKSAGSWAFPGHDPERGPTPAEVVMESLGRTWPWYG